MENVKEDFLKLSDSQIQKQTKDANISENVVDVYIRYLRAKIDEAFGKKYILTIRGVGYYVKEE